MFLKDGCINVDVSFLTIDSTNHVSLASVDDVKLEILSHKSVPYRNIRNNHTLMHVLEEVSDSSSHIHSQSLHIYEVIDSQVLLISDQFVALEVSLQATLHDQVSLDDWHVDRRDDHCN